MHDFDFQPDLTDGTVRVRPYTPADYAALQAAAADPEIWALHPIRTRWQEPVFRAFVDDGVADGGCLVIEDASSGEIIGHSRFSRKFCETADEVEIGWTFLVRSRWGGAWNRRVKRLMLSHALAHWGSVIFRVGEENWRSRGAMEKIGGQLTDRRQSITTPAGETIVHITYCIDRTAFTNGPLSQAGTDQA
jgi:N-acetyltransferase